MEITAILALASASLSIYERAMPLIRDAIAKGQISPDDQIKVRAEYDSLRARSAGQFQGAHWELSGRG